MARRTTDVLIVGAGPVGLATALGLAEAGVDFIIIDSLGEAQNTSRAAVIHAATLESLGKLHVADRLIAQGIRTPNFRIRDRRAILLHSDFTRLRTSTPFALMIPQDETEAILIASLSERGHAIRRPVRLIGIQKLSDAVIATCDSTDGELIIEARYLVGADGEKSTVRTATGIGFPGGSYGSFLLADVRMDWPISSDEVSLFFSQAGTLVVAPMSGGRHRVVAQFPDAPPTPTAADVQHIIDQRGPQSGARVREVLWGSRFQVHHKLADRFRDGRILLAGDAAHVHSPAGGQGMNLGLRDAEALARALVTVLRSSDDKMLDSYALERRVAAGKVLRMTHRLTRIAILSSPSLRRIRNAILATLGKFDFVKTYVASTLAGFR